MAEWTIEAQTRPVTGRGLSRRLRRNGWIPAVVYGPGGTNVPISVPARKVHDVLHSARGENTILTLALDGSEGNAPVIIKEFQLDPIHSVILHADFLRLDMTKEIQVNVPIHLTGTAIGVKQDGGLLDWTVRDVRVACLPGDIPGAIELDVAGLHIGDALRVKDIPALEKVRFLDDPERAIAHVEHPLKEEEAPAAAEAAPEEMAEPEVIKKGKEAKETEEGEGGEEEK